MSLNRTIMLGFITGLRSMAGITPVIEQMSNQPAPVDGDLPALLHNPHAATLFRLLQLGEMAADKLPFIPARTALMPLLGRAAFGGLVGYISYREDRIGGAIIGAGMAVIGSAFGYTLRKRIVQQTGIPDPLVALIEDAATMIAGKVATENTARLPSPAGR